LQIGIKIEDGILTGRDFEGWDIVSGFWSGFGFLIFQNLFLVWFWFKVCIIFWCGLGSEQNKCHTCLVTRRLWFRVPFWPSMNLKAFSLRKLIP